MAHYVITDASVTVAGTDLSDHVKSVSLDFSRDAADDSAMGDTWQNRQGGVFDVSGSIEFHQDFAASEVDATIWTAFTGSSPVTIIERPTSAAVGAANPNFTGTAVITSYSPIGGSHGDKAMAPVSFEGAGTWSRATS